LTENNTRVPCLVTGEGLGHQPVQTSPDVGETHCRRVRREP